MNFRSCPGYVALVGRFTILSVEGAGVDDGLEPNRPKTKVLRSVLDYTEDTLQ